MFISKVEAVDTKKVRIEIDGVFFGVLYNAEARELLIEEGKELSQLQYKELYELIIKRAKKRVFYLLGKRDYTIHEIEVKLKEAGLKDEGIKEVIHYFENFHYLDDHQYIEKYVRYHKSKKSQKQLKYDLIKKGIRSVHIDMFFTEHEIDEKSVIENLVEKKWRSFENLDKETRRRKIGDYLMRKGFPYEDIHSAIAKKEKENLCD